MTRANIITVDEAGRATARFIDARWFLPNDGREGPLEFAKAHIPGAVHFDLDKVSTPSADHPHLAPSASQMAQWLGAAGISPADQVVVYDAVGFFSAPRVWFLMKALGHQRVYVLEGGFAAWEASGAPVTAEIAAPPPTDYPLPEELVWPVVGRDAIEAAIETGEIQIADARPAGRFQGTDPEPRPGLPSGHMPGAVNIPFSAFVDDEGRFKSEESLANLLREAGLSPNHQVFATCGSGVSACVLLLGLAEAGWDAGNWLYDGSWIDWASRPGAEIITA